MIVNKYNQGGGGSGSGMTPQQVQQQIDTSLNPYWDSGETKDYVDEAVSGISLEGYYTSAQTEEAITSKGYASQDQVDEIDEVVAESLNDLQAKIDELSGATPDMSLYTPTSGFSTINGSAITAGGNLVIQGGSASGENYVERAESESTLIIPTNINDNENDAYIGTFEDGFAYRFQIGNERLANIHNTQIDEKERKVTGHRFANEEYVTKGDLNWVTQSLNPIVLDGPQYDIISQDYGVVVPTMRYEGIYWNQTDVYQEYDPTAISLWVDSGANFANTADPSDEEDILSKAEYIGDIRYIAGWNGAENVIVFNDIYGFCDENNPTDNYIAVKTSYQNGDGAEQASGFTAMMVEDGAEEWHTFDVGDGYIYGIYFNTLEDSENNRLEVVFEPSEDGSKYEGENNFECYRMEVSTHIPNGTNMYFDGLKYFDPDSGMWEDINKPVQSQIDTLDEVVAESLNDLNERVTVLEVSGGTPSVDLSGYYTSAQTEDAISAATSGKADAATSITTSNYITGNLVSYNSQGIITGSSGLWGMRITINGKSATTATNTSIIGGNLANIYAPTAAGNPGEILVSTGGTPVWSAVTIPDMSNYYTSAETFTSAQTQSAITAATQNMVTSTTITTMWRGTQAAYDTATQSGATADPNTFYIILPSA